MYTGTDGLLHASNQGEAEYLDGLKFKTCKSCKLELHFTELNHDDLCNICQNVQDYKDRHWSLKVNFDYPPIPLRQFDYSCTQTDYDLGDVVGRGATIQEAIEDWKDGIEFKVDHVDFSKEDINYSWS